MKFIDYVNLAKVKNNIKSNRKLAEVIGISSTAINLFANEKSTPSPDTYIKLATLSGCDEKEALLDLLINRYETTRAGEILKEIKKTYLSQ